MIKQISKIALVLFITFLSGLVMTDCVLPEIQAEERAETEIEQEEEIHIANLIQSDFISIAEDGGGKTKVNIYLQSFYCENLQIPNYLFNSNFNLEVPNQIKKGYSIPKYIEYSSLKLFI